MNWQPFIPKSIVCLQEGYSRRFFLNDLIAGISVGIIALPLAMSFAIGSGVSPERGIFTAIIAGFLISLLGGSRVQIGGPTGAYVIIVYEIVARHGYEGLAIATLIASVILILLGLTRCGTLIRFIPYPVTTGFTTGIATVIFTSMIKDFFGLQIANPSSEFLQRLSQYANHLSTFNPSATVIGILSLAIIICMKRKWPKIPGVIVSIVIATLIVTLFDLPIDTIETKFGPIPRTLPMPMLPTITIEKIQILFPDAVAIALLGAIESLLSAVVADSMTGFRHKSNLELVAQGIANFGSVLFGGIPATGAIARTTANIQMHAKTPVSGMVHAVTLFVLILILAPAAGKIPLTTLSAILMFVAYNMSEYERFFTILKGPRSDRIILLATYGLTVLIDLTAAVQVGIVLSIFFFMKHMTENTTLKTVKLLQNETDIEHHHTKENTPLLNTWFPNDTEVYEIEGPFFFGVSDILNEGLRQLHTTPKHFILRMRTVPLVDSSGMQALVDFSKKCKKSNITFYIVEVKDKVMEVLKKSGVVEEIGKDHFLPSLDLAIAKTSRK